MEDALLVRVFRVAVVDVWRAILVRVRAGVVGFECFFVGEEWPVLFEFGEHFVVCLVDVPPFAFVRIEVEEEFELVEAHALERLRVADFVQSGVDYPFPALESDAGECSGRGFGAVVTVEGGLGREEGAPRVASDVSCACHAPCLSFIPFYVLLLSSWWEGGDFGRACRRDVFLVRWWGVGAGVEVHLVGEDDAACAGEDEEECYDCDDYSHVSCLGLSHPGTWTGPTYGVSPCWASHSCTARA